MNEQWRQERLENNRTFYLYIYKDIAWHNIDQWNIETDSFRLFAVTQNEIQFINVLFSNLLENVKISNAIKRHGYLMAYWPLFLTATHSLYAKHSKQNVSYIYLRRFGRYGDKSSFDINLFMRALAKKHPQIGQLNDYAENSLPVLVFIIQIRFQMSNFTLRETIIFRRHSNEIKMRKNNMNEWTMKTWSSGDDHYALGWLFILYLFNF